MKFKYLGQDDTFTLELVAYGIKDRYEYMKYGDVVDVPDNLTNVITALDASGLYQRVTDKKTDKEKK